MFPVRLKQIVFAAAMLALAGCSGQGTTAMPPAQPGVALGAPAPAQTARRQRRHDHHQARRRPPHGRNPVHESEIRQSPRILQRQDVDEFGDRQTYRQRPRSIFNNVDTLRPHTASFFGDANSSHGAIGRRTFNGSSTPSPAVTAIGTTSFSTGTINPGTNSKKYNTGSPGFYMFGCAFHYNLDGMRTVIIVQ